VSEIIIRISLALLAKLQGRHAIYTLPDAGFAKKFAPTRFDPVIAASERLRAIVSQELNNTSVKQIGSSYLHIAGANSEQQSISVPASILIHDETAYSNQEVLGTYSSRLGHLQEDQEIVYEFSTPLLPNASIHKAFLEGTQDVYMVYHQSCNQWVNPDPITNLIIPHTKTPIELLSKSDITDNPNIDNAYIECPHCKQPISIDNLATPTYRAWVPTFPDRRTRSFDANFLVLPQIRTPAKILRDRLNYRSTEKWLNFAIGRPADSSDNRLTDSAIDNAFNLTESPLSFLTVAGMDVGKTCHLLIGRAVSEKLFIVHSALPKQDESNNSAQQFIDTYKQYRCTQGVIDAGPEFTVTTHAQANLPYNQVWGCYFTRGRGKTNLEFYEQKDSEGVVTAMRTRALDEFASDFNHGRILFLRSLPHAELIKKHLKVPARVTDSNSAGEDISSWISTSSEDHFFFAVFYTWLAWKMSIGSHHVVADMPESGILFGKARMRL
jgi:hypothetical protein